MNIGEGKTIWVSHEEYAHLTARRATVKAFIQFCGRPTPDLEDSFSCEQDDRAMKRMEDELRTRWGVEV